MTRCGELRDLIDVYARVKRVAASGEAGYAVRPIRRVWANVVPVSGRAAELPGEAERVEVTHRVIIRAASIPNLATDMVFVCRGLKLSVVYFYPLYKYRGWTEIYCRMVVEDGA